MFSLIRSRGTPAFNKFALAKSYMMPMGRASCLMPVRAFSTAVEQSDDTSNVPKISLEEFYSTVADFTISDEEALEYMNFSAKMSMVSFKN